MPKPVWMCKISMGKQYSTTVYLIRYEMNEDDNLSSETQKENKEKISRERERGEREGRGREVGKCLPVCTFTMTTKTGKIPSVRALNRRKTECYLLVGRDTAQDNDGTPRSREDDKLAIVLRKKASTRK